MKFTKVIEGNFGHESINGWNPLLDSAIRAAIKKGISLDDLQKLVSTNIKKGNYSLEGYHPVKDTNISIQGMNADNSLRNSLLIAQRLHVEIRVRFKYKEESHYPNQEGLIHWRP